MEKIKIHFSEWWWVYALIPFVILYKSVSFFEFFWVSIYVVFVILHRFYLRYVFYFLYQQFAANGQILSETLADIRKQLEEVDALTGHNVRKALWMLWRKSEGSNVGYFISTTINSFLWPGVWMFMLFFAAFGLGLVEY
jgi:hypothetical protein